MILKVKYYFLLILIIPSLLQAQSDVFSEKVDVLQRTYVKDGRVDYTAIKNHPELLNEIKKAFSKTQINSLDELQRQVFYINAYNFWVIDKVIAHYPITSVMNVAGFFEQPYIPWEDKLLSLNEFEQQIFYHYPDDPRLHLVIVCAANGCPKLSSRAFSENIFDRKMKERTRAALRDPVMVRLDKTSKTVHVSKIFEWYHADFTKNKSLLEFLNYYLNNNIPADFTIKYMEYDWSLNDTK